MSASLSAFAQRKLSELTERNARRVLRPGAADARSFRHRGESYVAFASNDYLGLSHHPEVREAARDSLRDSGAGALASRLVVGNHPGFAGLEASLAALKQTEAACVFGSGYHTNLGVIPALVGPEDVVFVDALAHACLYSGARLSRSPTHVFRHNDPESLRALLKSERPRARHAMVLTEGVFSMDGDRAPLRAISDLCGEHDAWLLVDDAHATGVIGPGGAGSAAAADLMGSHHVPLQVGTLSKAFGCYGGFLCASREVVDLIVTRARTFIYSTGLPPSVVASAHRALEVSGREAWRRKRVVELAQRLAEDLELPEPEAAIVPVPFGHNETVMAIHDHLLREGLWVPPIRPPTVPEGTARLRVSMSAAHTDAEVDALIKALRPHLPRTGGPR